MKGPTYVAFDGMTWPNPADPLEVEWSLRYGAPSREQMLVAASVVAAYRQLVEDPQRIRSGKVATLRQALAAAEQPEPAPSPEDVADRPCPRCGGPAITHYADASTPAEPFALVPSRIECRDGCGTDVRDAEPAHGGAVATHDVQVCARCGVRQRADDNPEFCWGCGYGVTVATQEPAPLPPMLLPDPDALPEVCSKSQRVDGPYHSTRWDGDDARTVCVFCGEVRDALSGAIIRQPRRQHDPGALMEEPDLYAHQLDGDSYAQAEDDAHMRAMEERMEHEAELGEGGAR